MMNLKDVERNHGCYWRTVPGFWRNSGSLVLLIDTNRNYKSTNQLTVNFGRLFS
jgi:hypothetical protein